MKKRLGLIMLVIVIISLTFSLGVIAKTDTERLLNKAPSEEDYPEAGGIYLETTTIADHTGPQSKIRYRKVIKVFNKRGVKEHGEIKIRFNKSSEDIKIVEAKTIKPDGSIIKPKQDAINEITPPEAANASIYSDARIKVISMSGVEPGSILICEYVKTKEEYAIKDQFWNYDLFQNTDPIKKKKLVVKAPAAKKVNYKVKNGDLEPEIEQQNNTKIYTWSQEDIPAVIKENNMPSLINIAPLVQVSTVDSWDEISNWYQGLITDQYQVNDQLRAKIEELIADDNTQEEKIKSLYNYVTDEIRYVGLQFGESGYKPYSAIETFTNKYGVCKEKATLLIAMLREIDVKAEAVLIRRGSGEIDLDIASPALFNHLIVYLPEKEKYLDPTSSGTMYGVLPGDQGKKVLLPEMNKLATTPVMAAERNKTAVGQQVKLKQDGSAQVVYQELNEGVFSYFYKRGYQNYTPQQRQKIVKSNVNKGFSNVEISGIQLSGVEDLSRVFKIDIADLKVNNYGQQMGSMITFSPFRFPLGLTTSLTAAEERKYPIYLGFNRQVLREIEIELPADYKVAYLPENIEFSNQVGQLNVDYTEQDRTIKIKFDLKINQLQIVPKDYSAARKLFTKADGIIQSQIMVQKK